MNEAPPGTARHRLIGIAVAVLAAHALLLTTVAGTRPPDTVPREPAPTGPLMVSWPAEAARRTAQSPAPAPMPATPRAPRPAPLAAPSAAVDPAPAGEAVDNGVIPAAVDAAIETAAPPGDQGGQGDQDEAVQLAEATPAPRPANAPPPADPPPSTQLAYEVSGQIRGFSYRANGELEWRRDADAYEARLVLSVPLFGNRVQTSRGTVGAEGLRPDRFGDQRGSERAAHFERDSGRIRFSNNAPEAVLMPGAQDRLSLFLQLAGLMRARPHAEGDAIEFQVAGTGDAEPWRFEVGPMERLELPAGNLEARRLLRAPRKAHDTTVEVWLAPGLNHLPVRLRVTQANGDVADQRLARLP